MVDESSWDESYGRTTFLRSLSTFHSGPPGDTPADTDPLSLDPHPSHRPRLLDRVLCHTEVTNTTLCCTTSNLPY